MYNKCDEIFNKNLNEQTKIKKLKNYKVGTIIGRGSYGIVHILKFDGDDNEKLFALKIIDLTVPEYLNKFTNEKNIFKSLTKNTNKIKCAHKNINCYLYVEQIENCGFIITQYFDTDLANYLKKKGNFGQNIRKNKDIFLPIYINWIKQLADAIKFLHKKKIAHGDLKPDNILIRYSDNNISITDFDTICMGKSFKKDSDFCVVEGFSDFYASPDLILSFGKKTNIKIIRESDIWALAFIILVMWFGAEELIKIFYNASGDFFFSKIFYESLDKKNFEILFSVIDNEINTIKLIYIDSSIKESLMSEIQKIHYILSESAIILSKIAFKENVNLDNYLDKIINL